MSTSGYSTHLAIITPTYQRDAGIKNLYDSIACQAPSGIKWHFIIINDSPDSSTACLDAIASDSRVIIHHNTTNLGPLISRNTGIEIATKLGADAVAFIDDDDRLAADAFQHISKLWKEHSNIGWLVSRCEFHGISEGFSDRFPETDGEYDWFLDMQLHRRFSDVFHIISLQRIGQIRFSSRGRHQREWTFLSQLAKSGHFFAANRVTKIVQYEETGLSNTKRGIAPDLLTVWNYLAKPTVVLWNRPMHPVAWQSFSRQLVRLPLRILIWLSLQPLRLKNRI